ncbi:MAG TPA: hypothetical protein VIJ70_10690 [Gaiellaceae bacterium]
MRRPALTLPVVVFAVALAGCGGSSTQKQTTTAAAANPAAAVGAGAKTIYQGDLWAVVADGAKAVALRHVGDVWKPDRSGSVKIDILGPKPGSTVAPVTQVAAELSAKTDLADSAIWIDGTEVLTKGGGLTPTRGTIYGSSAAPLTKGKHQAIAYGRTASTASAVAWSFSVR